MGSMHHYIMPPSALCPLRIKCARGYVIYIYSASSLTKHDPVLLPHQNGISTLIMTSMHTAYCQKRLLVPIIALVLLHLSAKNNYYCWRKKKLSKDHLPTLVRRQLELIAMKALQLQTTDAKLKIIIYQWTGPTKGGKVCILMIPHWSL